MGVSAGVYARPHFRHSYNSHDWNPDMPWVACLTCGCWGQSPALKPLCPVATHILLWLEEVF